MLLNSLLLISLFFLVIEHAFVQEKPLKQQISPSLYKMGRVIPNGSEESVVG